MRCDALQMVPLYGMKDHTSSCCLISTHVRVESRITNSAGAVRRSRGSSATDPCGKGTEDAGVEQGVESVDFNTLRSVCPKVIGVREAAASPNQPPIAPYSPTTRRDSGIGTEPRGDKQGRLCLRAVTRNQSWAGSKFGNQDADADRRELLLRSSAN
jgi:hypothetical protein